MAFDWQFQDYTVIKSTVYKDVKMSLLTFFLRTSRIFKFFKHVN